MSQLVGPSNGKQLVPVVWAHYSSEDESDATQDRDVDVDHREHNYQTDTPVLDVETEFCSEWDAGTCTRGDKCRFRHRNIHDEEPNSSNFNENWLLSLFLALNMPPKDAKDENDEGLEVNQVISMDNLEREKMFRELGRRRREEMAGPNKEEIGLEESREVGDQEQGDEEDFEEDQTNGIDNLLEELGEMRRNQRLSMDKWDEDKNEEERHNETDLSDLQSDDTTRTAATTEQYIVLESNLVTCGPGLEIRQIIPGYDLCQMTLQFPVDSTRVDVESLLSDEGLVVSDFHILKVEKSGEVLRVVVISHAKFGRAICARYKGQPIMSRGRWVQCEVRGDAIWTSGTMKGDQPTLTVMWDSNAVSRGGQSVSNALSDVYDGLLNTLGAQVETCLLLTPDTGSGSNHIKLTVEFRDWDSAQEIAHRIEAKYRRLVPSLRCSTATPPYSIFIPIGQYEAQHKQWQDLSQTRNGAHIDINVLENVVMIEVQGEDRAAVGALKVRAEAVVRGDVLDGPYWHPSFASAEDSDKFFRDVTKTAVIHLQRNPHTRALVVYGEPERVNAARKMIKDEVHQREQVMTKTALQEDSTDFFVEEGYQKLQDIFGEERVDFRITARWSTILMKGGEEATHHLQRLIRESQVRQPKGVQPATTSVCAVCFNGVSHPEMLECGHAYCAGCLDLFLKAAVDNKTFPIVCVGDEAKCNVPIALQFLRRYLSQHTFKILLQASFVSYLERNAAEFRYCRTPDCRQTYRKQASSATAIMLTCPSCFAKTCSACVEDHGNMTCDEYRIYRDPEEQERLNQRFAKSNGYKRCPHCAVWIEKTGGCNHMNCRCGAAFSW